MMRAMLAIFRRDLVLGWRQQGFLPLASFFLAAALIPFASPSSIASLQLFAPIVLWVLFLLALLFSVERFFAADSANGVEDWLATLPLPFALPVRAHCAAQLVMALPLVLAAALAGLLFFHMRVEAALMLALSLLAALPAIIFLTALPAALTSGLPRAGPLAALLIFPLYVPLFLFGTASARLPLAGFFAKAPFLLLLACSLLAIIFLPSLVARALRFARH